MNTKGDAFMYSHACNVNMHKGYIAPMESCSEFPPERVHSFPAHGGNTCQCCIVPLKLHICIG